VILRTKGRPEKADLKECKHAARYFADQLLSSKMRQHIKIRIWFSHERTKANGWYGYVDWLDDNLRPRDFDLVVDPSLSRRSLLITIAHEFVHIKQFATGQLKDYIRQSGVVAWMGKSYKDPREQEVGYFNSPWEREAVRLEKKLYQAYQEHFNYNTVRSI
jgi:hypothetical protein